MKLLMLSQNYAPVIGGEERHVQNLAEHLARMGHDAHVATMSLDGSAPAASIEGGVAVHRLPSASARLPIHARPERPQALPFPDPVLARALGRLVAELEPDVVHAHNWIVNSYLPVHRRRERPLVMSLHGYEHRCAVTRYVYEDAICTGPAPLKCTRCSARFYSAGKGPAMLSATWLMKPWKERAIDRFLPVSTAVAHGAGLDRAQVAFDVVPNFIPDALLEAGAGQEPRPEFLPGGDYLLFVGDLAADKGLRTLLSAYADLPAPKPALLTVGRRTDSTPSSFPAGVVCAEEWAHERVVAAFRHATAAALPSEWPDPCPTTVLEAMALGTPVVTTPVGGIADMVDGTSALIVAPREVRALREALRTLCENPELGRSLAAAAQRRVVRFTAGTVVPEIARIYELAITERAARGAGGPR